MNAVDTNVLVYAHRREAKEHDTAARTLRSLAEGPTAWAVPWPCVYEFVGVVTNPRIWKEKASTQEAAWAQLREWTGSPTLRLLSETAGFLDVLEGFLCRDRVRGAVVHDARIAALCRAHGIEALLTRDRDFSLFPELRTIDPFA